MFKSLMLTLTLLSLAAAPALATEVTSPLPHKTTLKTNHGARCNTPQGKSRKECAASTHH